MKAVMKLYKFGLFLLMCALGPADAQSPAPTTEQMVEQLKSPPRTRNLSIEAAPSAKPSLSLQIQFDFDSARVRKESQQVLINLAQALDAPALLNSRFAIEGHTDAKGAASYNLKLSEARAAAVVEFLKGNGVDASRLEASGKGSSEPANSAKPLAAENRRVRIVNLN
jgi:outer membrane protein OmpA-like peptidoglycan-associated protein